MFVCGEILVNTTMISQTSSPRSKGSQFVFFFSYLKTSEWLSEEKIRNDIKSHPVGEKEESADNIFF